MALSIGLRVAFWLSISVGSCEVNLGLSFSLPECVHHALAKVDEWYRELVLSIFRISPRRLKKGILNGTADRPQDRHPRTPSNRCPDSVLAYSMCAADRRDRSGTHTDLI